MYEIYDIDPNTTYENWFWKKGALYVVRHDSDSGVHMSLSNIHPVVRDPIEPSLPFFNQPTVEEFFSNQPTTIKVVSGQYLLFLGAKIHQNPAGLLVYKKHEVYKNGKKYDLVGFDGNLILRFLHKEQACHYVTYAFCSLKTLMPSSKKLNTLSVVTRHEPWFRQVDTGDNAGKEVAYTPQIMVNGLQTLFQDPDERIRLDARKVMVDENDDLSNIWFPCGTLI